MSLLTRDDYMLLGGLQGYVECQHRVSDAYRDQSTWTRMFVLNSARIGRYSPDRSIWIIAATFEGEGDGCR